MIPLKTKRAGGLPEKKEPGQEEASLARGEEGCVRPAPSLSAYLHGDLSPTFLSILILHCGSGKTSTHFSIATFYSESLPEPGKQMLGAGMMPTPTLV